MFSELVSLHLGGASAGKLLAFPRVIPRAFGMLRRLRDIHLVPVSSPVPHLKSVDGTE